MRPDRPEGRLEGEEVRGIKEDHDHKKRARNRKPARCRTERRRGSLSRPYFFLTAFTASQSLEIAIACTIQFTTGIEIIIKTTMAVINPWLKGRA